MKTFGKQAAQGDLLVRRIKDIPEGLAPMVPEGEVYVVGHSETGHHHVLPRKDVHCFQSNDPLVSYVVVEGNVELRHLRAFDTHEALGIGPGNYEIRRQREHTPEGWRRVQD